MCPKVAKYNFHRACVCSAVNSAGCSVLDMGNNNPPSNDPQYWNIISMRRVEVAFFIISVVLTGIAVLVHGFCCIPHCRHEAGNGYWKNGIASGVLSGFAGKFTRQSVCG